MNRINKLFFTLSILVTFAASLQASTLVNDSVIDSSKPLVDNVHLRFMLRSEVRGVFNKLDNNVGYFNRPAMMALGFDMGDKLSFYSRYRFDFPTDIQKDGTPVSLLAFNLQYKPKENMKFVVGKQIMLQGSWEFEYNPVDVYYYSLMGNHVQGFVSGVAFHYNIKRNHMAFQFSKVVDKDYLWNDNSNGFNSTLYYASDFGNGFFKPIWSYTYTYAGDGKSLHNVMIGNQFNVKRVKVELDAMAQNAFRYYDGIQKKTNEYSLVGRMEYLFPNDRMSIAGKYAYDKRNLDSDKDRVTTEQTISAQLRYLLSEKYGVTLHSTAAYRINDTPLNYRNSFDDINSTMFSLGVTWDFTTKL